MSEPVELTDSNFESEVLNSELPCLVDFWAEWCGPCQMVGPIVEEIGKEYAGKLKVGKLNVDQNSQTAVKYGIMSIPTLLVFKNGRLVDQIVGAMPRKMLEPKITCYLE